MFLTLENLEKFGKSWLALFCFRPSETVGIPVSPLLLLGTRYVRLKKHSKCSVPGYYSGGREIGIRFGFYCSYNSEPLKMS